jgi:hypothetical protein
MAPVARPEWQLVFDRVLDGKRMLHGRVTGDLWSIVLTFESNRPFEAKVAGFPISENRGFFYAVHHGRNEKGLDVAIEMAPDDTLALGLKSYQNSVPDVGMTPRPDYLMPVRNWTKTVQTIDLFPANH